MRNHRRFALGATMLVLALAAGACSSGGGATNTPTGAASSPAVQRGTLTIGVSGAYAENQLVAEMYAQVLEKAGYTIKRQLDLLDRPVSDPALFDGQIDMKPEYLAFELPKLDPNADNTGTAEEVYPRLQAAAKAKGITVLHFSPADSTNVFVVKPETATANNLTNMSSLVPVASQLTLGAPPDCNESATCEKGLKDVYGITFKSIKSLDLGGPKTKAAIDNDAVDVGELFSLDPDIATKGYTVLEDDKHLQGAGNFVPMIRTEKLNDEIASLLNAVTAKLTTDGMLELVTKVQVEHEDVADVAKAFLQSQGLL
jgi:osmoprotectant transport system substrate-binding protein